MTKTRRTKITASPGMTLVPPGRTSTRPTLAVTSSSARAASRSASTTREAPAKASRRSVIGVVPGAVEHGGAESGALLVGEGGDP